MGVPTRQRQALSRRIRWAGICYALRGNISGRAAAADGLCVLGLILAVISPLTIFCWTPRNYTEYIHYPIIIGAACFLGLFLVPITFGWCCPREARRIARRARGPQRNAPQGETPGEQRFQRRMGLQVGLPIAIMFFAGSFVLAVLDHMFFPEYYQPRKTAPTHRVMGPLFLLIYPWAFVVALIASRLKRRYEQRHGAERHADLCPKCGYDLRATPERCPECGTPRAKPYVNQRMVRKWQGLNLRGKRLKG